MACFCSVFFFNGFLLLLLFQMYFQRSQYICSCSHIFTFDVVYFNSFIIFFWLPLTCYFGQSTHERNQTAAIFIESVMNERKKQILSAKFIFIFEKVVYCVVRHVVCFLLRISFLSSCHSCLFIQYVFGSLLSNVIDSFITKNALILK